MPHPEHPELIRFLRRATEGVQRPPIFEADDGHTYVLKLDTMDRDFPAAELVGAGLAGALTVPSPPYRVLRASGLLVDVLMSTGDPDLREFGESFARTGGLCFGSRYLPGVTVKWDVALRHRVNGADGILARLLVFDAFIENGDRSSAHNPNLLVSNGAVFAIDHGQALPSVQGIFSKTLPYPFDSHLGWPTVLEQPHLLERPLADLRALPGDAIDAAVGAVPAGWRPDADRPARVRAALRVRRDHLPATILSILESRR
jgi:hypothetical protein